jgi:hypothetical protein
LDRDTLKGTKYYGKDLKEFLDYNPQITAFQLYE